ncbi:D-2-hydroxyacid dehydrogenase [Nicoliella spurrieriana]|uniref:D-2-hydroxyacid dehydrogenase n=1 Tax=Nicoliella spurrieriana TaxID=2925830 RepID=A0A976RTA3_9LACO|nr:D-2-hydroxyacid dehydrogenase [Nicoliella spurrieriana]UQS87447.1 D-2-hydroxyacid dehydrogenase [Nicoliella spurrieriana]
MKILMLGARPDEQPAADEWAKANGVTVDTNPAQLSLDNVDLVDGYDGVSVLQLEPLEDPAVYKALADHGIKNLAVRSTGYESYNLKAARDNGITVTNVPAYSPRSVAEHTLTLTMNLLRKVHMIEVNEHHNDFSWAGVEAPEIHNLTIGIIGAGKIGSTVARIFKALGSTVIATDPIHRPELGDTLEYVDYDTLLSTADVVTMHTPLTDDMYHFMDQKRFAQMKKSAIFINASRGKVVNTPDLIEALKTGEIQSAGLDTVEDEDAYFSHKLPGEKTGNPYIDTLLPMKNVVLTPHIAFYTDMAVKNMVQISLNNTKQILDGETPFSPVN